MDKYAKYGEPLMWIVMASCFPVIFIWQNIHMPVGSILYWGIPACIVSTIGFLLNRRHIKNESARLRREFSDMQARHNEMLGKK